MHVMYLLSYLMIVYLVIGVAAEVGGAEFHQALQRKNTDGVATHSSVLLGDGVHACFIWRTEH